MVPQAKIMKNKFVAALEINGITKESLAELQAITGKKTIDYWNEYASQYVCTGNKRPSWVEMVDEFVAFYIQRVKEEQETMNLYPLN